MPPRSAGPAPVKSAKRVLEVFELFDKLRRPLGVTEVAHYLGYPLSSTAMLLRSLVGLGYMHQDPHHRSYVPTPRIALLGEWIGPATWGRGDIGELMARVHAATGEVTILAARLGLDVQYMAIIEPDSGDMTYMPGTRRPLFHTASGIAILSTYADAVIGQLVRHHNAVRASEKRVALTATLREIEETRQRGYSRMANMIRSGRGSVAMLLPLDPLQDRPIALSVSADTDILLQNEAAIIAAMREALEGWHTGSDLRRRRKTAAARPGGRSSSSRSAAGKGR